MRNLKKDVESINLMSKLFGVAEIDVHNIDAEEAQRLFEKIDCDLSPENLCCDGELSRAHWRRNNKLLRGAAAELKKLGFAPRNCYEI